MPQRGTACWGWWSKQQLKLQQRAPKAVGGCGWYVTSSGHDLCAQGSGAVWSRGYQGRCHVMLCVSTSASTCPDEPCPVLSGVTDVLFLCCTGREDHGSYRAVQRRDGKTKGTQCHMQSCRKRGKRLRNVTIPRCILPAQVERLSMQIKLGKLETAVVCSILLEN